jgi:hypothetical protein
MGEELPIDWEGRGGIQLRLRHHGDKHTILDGRVVVFRSANWVCFVILFWLCIVPGPLVRFGVQYGGADVGSNVSASNPSVGGATLVLGRGRALLGVGHENGEARVTMERFEIGVLFDGEIECGGQPVVNRLP